MSALNLEAMSPRLLGLVARARSLATIDPFLSEDDVYEAAIEAAGDAGFDPIRDEAAADAAVVAFSQAYVEWVNR